MTNDSKDPRSVKRLAALRRFAVAITILNVVGRLVLGLEPSWAQMFAAMLTAYSLEVAFECVDAWGHDRSTRLRQATLGHLIDFLLPAHITAMACSMLIYANDRIWPIVFAVAVGLGSKAALRIKFDGKQRHFLNPSNTGIAAVLLVFPWVGVAQPYQFTEKISGAWDAVVPCIIICTGTFLNARFTGRVPLIAAWLGGFGAQAALRSFTFDTPLAAALGPMTGMAFLLFTFYMATDPATTPTTARAQVQFGIAIAIAYGLLQVFHVVYGFFFALVPVCLTRGALLAIRNARARSGIANVPAIAQPEPAMLFESTTR